MDFFNEKHWAKVQIQTLKREEMKRRSKKEGNIKYIEKSTTIRTNKKKEEKVKKRQ